MLSLGNIVQNSKTSLFWRMYIPQNKRNALYTILAFCDHINSLVTSVIPMDEKEGLLKAWKEEIDNIYDKKVPSTDIGRKIYKNCMRYNLSKDNFIQILNSASLNIPHPLQAPSFDVFYKYVDGAAVVPLNLILQIIGEYSEELRNSIAKNVGRAIFLTYILSDIKDAAKTNRVLIPKDILLEVGINTTSPIAVVESKNLISARIKLSYIAEKYFENVDYIIETTNLNKIKPVLYLYDITYCYFYKMKQRGWEIISPKPIIEKSERISLFIKRLFS